MAKIDYYVIHRWMREDLHLEDTELHCYAVIYGLSQGENWYNAGVKNIMDVLGKSEPTVISALKNLTEKGLIVKVPVIINNAKRNYYKSAINMDETTLNNLSNPTLNNLSNPTLNNLSTTKINNIKENKKRECNKLPSPKKVFVKPTIKEIADYIKEKKYSFDAEHFWNYYEAVGWKIGKNHMKNWKSACATWEGRRKQELKDKEEKEETPEIPATDIEPWNNCQKWMQEFTPRIADMVTYDDFARMRGMAMFRSEVCANIWKDINASDFEGDIVEEFERLLYSDKYSEMFREL